jgi:chromosome segregation protein
MKIKKIDIVGFKSFLEKASIVFPEGISAIVGPNGCGKSNVIDALRWVMGEQSVKQLRGKNMEDVIFAGANGKPPLNMAEVTLTLANDNGHAPREFRDYTEISVTRRLYRSGESAYMINRQPCRLKDIYNLFMGSGVGTRTFSIIQQGNIGAIIDAGPDERRLFIEEAAGVTRYKFRKNEALRKIKATGRNLERLNDILSEINRQMAGLKRQAKKAERFKNYQQRVKQIDTHLLLHYYDDYSEQLTEAEDRLKVMKDEEIGHVAQMKKIDAAIEEIKFKRQKKDQEIAAQKSSLFETQRKIDRTEGDRSHLSREIKRLNAEIIELDQARSDLKAKTETMATEIEAVHAQNNTLHADIDGIKSTIEGHRNSAQTLQEQLTVLTKKIEERKNALMNLVAEEARLKNIFQNASNNKETLCRRLRRIDEEVLLAEKKVKTAENDKQATEGELERIRQKIEAFSTTIDQLKTSLTESSTALGKQVKQTHTIELECNQVRSQLANLKKMAENFEWYRDGVKAIMKAQTAEKTSDNEGEGSDPAAFIDGIIGLLAEVIEPQPGYDVAVEAVLGEALQYILVDDQHAGAKAISYLQAHGKGRSGFIPVTAVKSLAGCDPASVSAEHRLLQYVSVQDAYRPIAEALLGHVAVVPSMPEALELFNRNGRVQTIVTQAGDVVSHQGVLVGGSQDKLSGILAKKQELKALQKQSERLDRDLDTAKSRQQEMEVTVRELETQLQQTISEKSAAAEQAVEAEKTLYRNGEDLKNASRHLEIVELEQEQLIGEESDLDEEMARYNAALAKVSEEVRQAQDQTTDNSQRINELSNQLEVSNQQIVDLKLQLTAYQTKLENGMATLNRLKEFEQDSHNRIKQLQLDIEQKKNKLGQAQAQLAAGEQSLAVLYENLKRMQSALSNNESEFSSIDNHLQQHGGELTAVQSERQKTLEKIRVVELDLSEKRIKRDNIAGKAQERYHVSIGALRMQQKQNDDELQMAIPEMEKELDRFRIKISRIGDVNLGAIKEYEDLSERFNFLNTQRSDLENAISDLHQVISKINHITQTRFIETFEKVNAKLMQVFPKLFEGGAARLELTEPNKPLETGVEYLVHPPGKKLTRMSLLSGGEKALSAIAFIFAIFLIRPASFCLLDEIDAPLDEANIVRFNNLMKVIGQKSQIIMITHNKRSMEFAETLYGVTMEQKGISKVVSVNLKESQA